MSIYAGLDVSDKTTHICVVDADGRISRRDVVARDPDVLAKWHNRHCKDLVRVVLETGPLSTFLYHGLVERGVAVECICARHACPSSKHLAQIWRGGNGECASSGVGF